MCKYSFTLVAILASWSVHLVAQETPVSVVEVEDNITIGDDTTQAIDTNLNGFSVPADIGQIFIGNTIESADAITIDSGNNFPGGIAFRRYLGVPNDPELVTAGTQLGYLDFRGYSGTQFFNAASLDVVVDGLSPIVDGLVPPTKTRFAVSDGQKVYSAMELRANGRLELGAISGANYNGPGSLGDPKLFVNTDQNDWSTIFAARPVNGLSYGLRVHTAGETEKDFIFGGSSGAGTGRFKFSIRGNGDVHIAGKLFLGELDASEAIMKLHKNLFSDAVSIGLNALATSSNALAIGNSTISSGANSLALGASSRANGIDSISIGGNAISSGQRNVAIGAKSVASAIGSVALGGGAKAIRDGAIAVGNDNLAQGTGAIALGSAAIVLNDRGTAVGAGADVRHDNSTALGAGAKTTAANQVMIGSTGTSVVVADIDASTAAQEGPVDVVTVDSNGTLGRQRVASSAAVDTMRVSLGHIAAISDAQFAALDARVSTLEGDVLTLFDLTTNIDKDAQQGIAAVAAMAHPHFPSEAGKTSYASNVATYRGEVGFSAGLMHRFEGDFAITAGATYAGGDSATFKAGIAGEF